MKKSTYFRMKMPEYSDPIDVEDITDDLETIDCALMSTRVSKSRTTNSINETVILPWCRVENTNDFEITVVDRNFGTEYVLEAGKGKKFEVNGLEHIMNFMVKDLHEAKFEWFIPVEDAIEEGGGGTSNYEDLTNKPSINSVTLSGNKTAADLGLIGRTDTTASATVHGEVFNDYSGNKATNTLSHAEGFTTEASGRYSHAEGYTTHAQLDGAHAEGGRTTASGQCSHAEGFETNATGYTAHAEGYQSEAKAKGSHAEGNYCIADSENSHAEGLRTLAYSKNQHVQGKFNISDTREEYAFIIGNGSDADHRSNALTVDWEGNITTGKINGITTSTLITSAIKGVANGVAELDANGKIPSSQLPSYVDDVIEGETVDDFPEEGETGKIYVATSTNLSYRWSGTQYVEISPSLALGETSSTAYRGDYGKIAYDHSQTTHVGKIDTTEDATKHGEIFNDYEKNKAIGEYSHAEGYYNTASGFTSHAEGYYNTASGYNSHVEGYRNTASGYYSHVEGEGNTASGYWSHAEGNGSVASEKTSHAEGGYTKASGQYSHAEGYYTEASGMDSHAEGNHTKATKDCAHAEGKITEASGYYSHAEGENTKASGMRSHAEGEYTESSGTNSHVEGEHATASGINSHAEGCYSEASGYISHAQNYKTKASSDYQTAMGKFNVEDTEGKYALIIGNGTRENARSNALTVDWDGKINGHDITNKVDKTTVSAEGIAETTATITVPEKAKAVSVCTMRGKTIKKNLFDIDDFVTNNSSKATKTDSVTLTVKGTWYASNNITLKANTKYTLSITVVSSNVQAAVMVCNSSGSSLMTESLKTTGSATFTTGSDTNCIIRVYSGNATSGTSVYSNIQLEEGESATKYVPYGTLSNATNESVVSQSKNLMNTNGWIKRLSSTTVPYMDGEYFILAKNESGSSEYVCKSFYINKTGSYILKVDDKTDSGILSDIGYSITDSPLTAYINSFTTFGMSGNTSTAVSVTQGKYLNVVFALISNKTGTLKYKNLRLIESTYSSDAYTPYFKHTAEIPISLTSLADYGKSVGSVSNYIDFENGLYYHNVGTLKLASLGWDNPSDYQGHKRIGAGNVKTGGSGTSTSLICNIYTADTSPVGNGLTDKTICFYNSSLYVSDWSNLTDKSTFVTYLQNTNAELVYELSDSAKQVIDISDIIRPLKVEAGGTVTFVNPHNIDCDTVVKYKKEV